MYSALEIENSQVNYPSLTACATRPLSGCGGRRRVQRSGRLVEIYASLACEQRLQILGERVGLVEHFLLFGAKSVQDHKPLVALVLKLLRLRYGKMEHVHGQLGQRFRMMHSHTRLGFQRRRLSRRFVYVIVAAVQSGINRHLLLIVVLLHYGCGAFRGRGHRVRRIIRIAGVRGTTRTLLVL